MSQPTYAPLLLMLFFFNDTATTEIYTLSLHDALPICSPSVAGLLLLALVLAACDPKTPAPFAPESWGDRKSTRLNSSHSQISYAVFCLKKKTDRKVPYSLRMRQSLQLDSRRAHNNY